jgi:hypothetical protein
MVLLGYDPRAEKYLGVAVGGPTPSPSRFAGTRDAGPGTWTLATVAGDAPPRTTVVWHDADACTVTGYGKGRDGKEAAVLRIERKRARPPAAGPAGGEAEATAVAPTPAPPADSMHARLWRLAGKWACEMELPDHTTTPATETVSAIGNGNWLWTDFRATFGDRPFEGHALWGYDTATNRFVSFWIDSTTAGLTEASGHLDEKNDLLVLTGTMADAAGARLPLRETLSWPGEHTRVLVMDIGKPPDAARMTLTYRREQDTGGYHIKR